MRAEILIIGDEILTGRISDTNSGLIIRKLQMAGVPIRRVLTCGDDESELVMALNQAAQADLLVVAGGLGPTDDDRTAKVAAKVFGRPMKLDTETLEWLKGKFKEFGVPFSQNNESQCWFPEGSQILDNPNGTARGFAVEHTDGKLAIFLPGPPRELSPMVDLSVVPLARKHFGLHSSVVPLVFKTFGITESGLDQVIAAKPLDLPGCTVGFRAHFPEIHLHVTVEAEDEAKGTQLVEQVRDWAHERMGGIIFSEEASLTLEGVVVGLLKQKCKKLALAESCTGGMISQMITDVSGASDVFDRGNVTYSNEAKIQMLGVKDSTLEDHGAVSEFTALEMAEGARKRSGADLALSVTGIAGPTGGTEEKPVGTVFIAMAGGEAPVCRRFQFRGSRLWIRTLTAYAALDLARRTLLGEEPWTHTDYLLRWQSRKK